MSRDDATAETSLAWAPEAQARLEQVPEGLMRELTRQRVERLAHRLGNPVVTVDMMDAKYRQWAVGSEQATSEMTWTDEAQARIERIPSFVRGMVVNAVEAYAHLQGLAEITPTTLDEAKKHWGHTGQFHLP